MLPENEFAQYAQVVQMLQQLDIEGHLDPEPDDDADSILDLIPSDASGNGSDPD